MKSSHVFTKTTAGEEAVQHRTRLVQRSLRNILIMVDGRASVADLIAKAGDETMVRDGLEQLQKDGFIALGGESEEASKPDLIEEKRLEPSLTDDSSVKHAPVFFPVAAEAEQSPFMGAVNSPPSPFAATAVRQHDLGPASVSPALPLPRVVASSAASPFVLGSGVAASPSPFAGTEERAQREAQSGAPAASELKFKPSRRGFRISISLKHVLLATGAIVAVAMLGFLFFPYGNYLANIEASLSAALDNPVKIGRVSARFSPAPMVVLSDVTIGSASRTAINEIAARPAIATLFSGRPSFDRVSIAGVSMPLEQLGTFASSLGAASRAQAFSVSKVEFHRTTISMRDIVFSDYSGGAEFASDGQLKRLALGSQDGRFQINAEMAGKATNVTVEGRDWRPGESSPYIFDSLAIQGELNGSRFAVQKIDARIFGGVLQGQMTLDWTSGMAVAGDISADYLAGDLLGKALGSGSLTLDGQVNARFKFKSAGESWAALSGKIPLEGNFVSKNGGVNGLDLIEAVRRQGSLPMRGGTTKFEELTGNFRWDTRSLRVSEIELASGLVRAGGSIGIADGGNLSGALDIQLRGSATTVSARAALVGTLKDPQLIGGR